MSSPVRGPAFRVRTARTIVRCWEPRDASLLKEAVDASQDHLRPWMPWARGAPEDVRAIADKLRLFRGKFDLGQDFTYGIFDRDGKRVLGGTGLHTRVGEGALEIGYWIRVECINEGLATEVSAGLARVAFEVNQVDRVEIHCDARNARSAAVPRKLGFVHDATLRRRGAGADGGPHDTMIWTMFRDEFPGGRAASYDVEAYDVVGSRLL